VVRWPYPRVIAHRGAGRFAPENTLAALRKGHELGFRGVEFDVMLASEGVPVLMHDETLERTTDARGRVPDTPADVLATLDAGSWFDASFKGEAVPGFEAAAALCMELGLWANIEIKPALGYERETGRIAGKLAAQIMGTASPLPLLSSFSPEALAAARKAAPQLPRGLLFDAVPSNWRAQLEALGCVALHCSALKIDERAALDITGAGFGLACWTVNDTELARRLFGWGVDAVFTDRLDLLGPDFADGYS
jgi:glycerophosphoryl diester phosphodiesterase